MNNEKTTAVPENPDNGIRLYTDWNAAVFNSEEEKFNALFQIFKFLLEQLTLREGILFPTLFSRLAYIGQEKQLDTVFLYYAHAFRRCPGEKNIPIDAKINLGKHIITTFFYTIWPESYPMPPAPLPSAIKTYFSKKNTNVKAYVPSMYGVIISVDTDSNTFTFIPEAEGENKRTGYWNVIDKNELFNENLITLQQSDLLPVTVNLLEVDVTDSGELYPRGFVIQPDFLVDATAIAECFKETGSHAELYILNKLRPPGLKIPILLGNITNYILDHVFLNEEANLEDLAPVIFQKFGLSLSVLDDNQMKEVWNAIKIHFANIKKTIQSVFPGFNIRKENSYLEPSFYSNEFGIQGRLDLWSVDTQNHTMSIVELKSGSVYRPNVYGINASHFIQTQIYEMLLRSSFGKRANFIKNYIFYSKEKSNHIRFAPFIKPQQWEILTTRNSIVFIEEQIKRLVEAPDYFKIIDPDNLNFLKGFTAGHAEEFQRHYLSLSTLEKSYFIHFLSFVAREYSLSKTGIHGIENARGNAALWLESVEEKKERFAILTGLKMFRNLSQDENPTLVLVLENQTQVSNFRQGDIVVLYPHTGEIHAPLQQQLYKCSIAKFEGDVIELRLRNKQFNASFFDEHLFWNIEEDLLDSSFHKLNEALVEFIRAPKAYRDLFLAITPPAQGQAVLDYDKDDNLTTEQNQIVQQAVSSQDFYLIWGPPGTGKTSTVLRKITEYLYQKTTENVLILAYTNRAVDEICESILNIFGEEEKQFIRIGSKLSAHPAFHEYLLDHHLERCSNRKEIRDLLQNSRIFVSTVSSILGKPELFLLKTFNTVIIDEASQILEPYLCGLLQKISRRILIGDHKQLPAVVQQENFDTIVKDEGLRQAGFLDLADSLFERLYISYQNNRWNHAFGILTYQGRMHPDIQTFVNDRFYNQKLKLLSDYFPYIKSKKIPIYNPIGHTGEHRVIFIDNQSQVTVNGKINVKEAGICVEIIQNLKQLFDSSGILLTPSSIGVITPFRAQITQIKKLLAEMDPGLSEIITVDTVERYQGGARDIIIISSCIQNHEQLKRVTSFDHEGVDRKLNVALTRAKEQIIMIGNKEILKSQPVYSDWISASLEINFKN